MMNIKKFVALILAVLMTMTFTAIGFAEGDIYTLAPQGAPDRFWGFMSDQEIAEYEAQGYQRYIGVLFTPVDYDQIRIEDVQDLYNEGVRLEVHYSWIHDRLPGFDGEFSVSVGVWILTAEEAIEFIRTYQVPELDILENEPSGFVFESGWYLDGQRAFDPSGDESRAVLDLFTFVREEWAEFDRGFGEVIYLKTGVVEQYTFDEAVRQGGFDNEVVWN